MNGIDPTPEFGHGLRHLWHLDPAIRFLNHGSFGATPKAVLAAQGELRLRMEAEPVRFMLDELPQGLRHAAACLGRFVGAAASNLAFAFNATEAINGIVASFDWRAGDEIVIANHAYPAVRNAVQHIARRHGVGVVDAAIPFPLSGAEAIVDAFAAALTARTRMLIVDHVYSPLAVVSPVAAVVELCRARDIAVLVDGAHAPGMLPLALDALDADWFVGNAHKWMFAAKGCAFLHAAPRHHGRLHPAVISNFHGDGFPAEFDWIGTHDYTAWLSLPTAIGFIEGFGCERYRDYLKTLTSTAAAAIASEWQVELPAPLACCAAMATLPLPPSQAFPRRATAEAARRLRRRLLDEIGIEVPFFAIDGLLHVRISAQVYNEIDDYAALASALKSLDC